ncbi:3'(2'),5'-bisphosphate nucleotidase CysQ [Dokdonia pacifica]|uniref:3'(2'),5'-bisphosphate nucleotidase CysQ n=1 Tax=Dokdonia pacifica TaxID=1627892 RepID=A0A239C407_9FLAO|nr:3'(2'),5'-bisphosphate nucleotidase CysQ [Dokdonia pacifica]GGG26836.1 3'(2'),5'-bisphosphate nucleotidase CysQ [Dokdonia pacifica]SNS14408.1 3'(2'),5'-bisphosphate nucleotidase [Dokdonia pacifica]
MITSYLHTAIKAAIDGGKAIMEIYATDFDVIVKDDQSPLTIADQNANAIINDYLETTHIPIISEENKQLNYAQRKDWSSCWIVDPLDGTKEFIKRNGEFTVNIALVHEGAPFLGVIYIPVSKTLYFTSEDATSSYKYIVDTEKEISIEEIITNAVAISPSKQDNPIKIMGSRSHLNEATKQFISEIENKHKVAIVSRGSSLKFCVIAEGEAHMYPRFAPTMEWDTAAGHAICKAVGVEVINQETQQPLQYNKENLLNPYFMVNSLK